MQMVTMSMLLWLVVMSAMMNEIEGQDWLTKWLKNGGYTHKKVEYPQTKFSHLSKATAQNDLTGKGKRTIGAELESNTRQVARCLQALDLISPQVLLITTEDVDGSVMDSLGLDFYEEIVEAVEICRFLKEEA